MTTDVLIQVTELQKHFKGEKQTQDDKIRALLKRISQKKSTVLSL